MSTKKVENKISLYWPDFVVIPTDFILDAYILVCAHPLSIS